MKHKPIPKLLQFLRDNRTAPRAALTVKNDGEGETASATVYLYDVIDSYWGINAEDFAKALAAITAPTIHLRVNSPGGDVFEARAMVAAIRAHPSNVIAHIDGLAASAATYVAMAADSVEMTQGAFLMIHNAWTLAYGNATDLRNMADLLDKIDASIIHDYITKTGKDTATLQAWMAAETWFTADEAKAEGFIDTVVDPASTEPAPANKWNLASFDKAPKALLERSAPVKNAMPLSAAAAEYLAAKLAECTTALARAKAFITANPDDPIRDFAEEEVEDEAGCIETIQVYQSAGTASGPSNQLDGNGLRAAAQRRLALLEKVPA